ncbi:hypothetical protein EMPG_15953 [Blastomyces silverae]|uniref:Uncharacterized protein n=1 Tax=Blastomyces silverae TaxID=2060906 RepID=A0A0H1BHG3_9EURO|nr:hypothetical protein EMPG_15953 [Blastomyces silverae]
MRLSSTILLLPALAAAQDQIPLKDQVQGWFNKVKSFLPTATPVVSSAASSAATAATSAAAGSKGGSSSSAKVVSKEVTPITNGLLCTILSATPASIWHWQVPAREPGQPKPKTLVHLSRLNATAVDAEDIYKVHSEKTWENKPAFDGTFHPVDGTLAQYGLSVPFGYAMYYISMVPSWAMMVGISFISRTLMSRRMGPPRPQVAPAAGAAQ